MILFKIFTNVCERNCDLPKLVEGVSPLCFTLTFSTASVPATLRNACVTKDVAL
jgi:hypothetical protein